MDDRRIGSLLGRWHQWRRAYSHERGYARPVMPLHSRDAEDQLEHMTMMTLEDEITGMPQELQIALQHVARAECMGVEVITNPRLGDSMHREALVGRALFELHRRLLRAGLV